jgi:hypothetical protein
MTVHARCLTSVEHLALALALLVAQPSPQPRDHIVKVALRSHDMILRTTPTGACVLVPFGPRLSMNATRDWVWFVRAETLYRVSAHGGRTERVEHVPFFAPHIRFHDAAVYGNRILRDPHGYHLDSWVVEASDEPPRDPPTCR